MEVQVFRNEGRAVAPSRRKRGELLMRSAAKSSNIVPTAELKNETFALVPSFLQGDISIGTQP